MLLVQHVVVMELNLALHQRFVPPVQEEAYKLKTKGRSHLVAPVELAEAEVTR